MSQKKPAALYSLFLVTSVLCLLQLSVSLASAELVPMLESWNTPVDYSQQAQPQQQQAEEEVEVPVEQTSTEPSSPKPVYYNRRSPNFFPHTALHSFAEATTEPNWSRPFVPFGRIRPWRAMTALRAIRAAPDAPDVSLYEEKNEADVEEDIPTEEMGPVAGIKRQPRGTILLVNIRQ